MGDTNAQYNHINRDDGNTKRDDVDVENMQREEEKGRERKTSEGAAGCSAGGSKHSPVVVVYRKQCSRPELKLLLKLNIITQRVFFFMLKTSEKNLNFQPNRGQQEEKKL